MDPELDAVLPSGLVRQAGPPQSPPVDFQDGYVLPEHSVKPLQLLNTHPLDARLVFYEKPHIYTVDGVPTSVSVTGLAHLYEKPFVAQDAISGMKTSRTQAWPRLEYVVDARPITDSDPWTSSRGVLHVCSGKTTAALPPHSLGDAATHEAMLKMLQVTRRVQNIDTDEGELYSYERERTNLEIEQGWSRNGQLASNKGTEAHYNAECFFNGVPFRWWDADMQPLYDFCRTHLIPRGIVGFNTEKEILCVDADLAGSLDLIVYDPTRNVHHIIDHKRSDKLQASMWGFKKMSKPFMHLDDCKGAAYALQTSIYQYVLEREYGMTIGERILLSLHADRPYATAVPYLKAEVAFLMEDRFALVTARRRVAEEDPTLRCALTQAPVVDAVRLEDGRVVMEKAALVRELPYTVAHDVREVFEAKVQALYVPPTLRRNECVAWRTLVPQEGLVPFE
jgi:hypothetical protein